MTGETTDTLPEENNVLAAEYVLGVLEAGPRLAAAARIERDLDFAAMVKIWEQRLDSLNAAYAPVAPPADLKQKLMTRLFGHQETKSQGPWQTLKFWRGVATGALAVSLIAIGMSLFDRQPALTSEPLIASLQADTGSVRFIAFYETGTNEIRVSKLEAEKTPQQDFELWLIEADGIPQSLGVIPNTGRSSIGLSAAFVSKINAGDTFAVSIEPLGGSPTGEVTGPVIAAGVSSLL